MPLESVAQRDGFAAAGRRMSERRRRGAKRVAQALRRIAWARYCIGPSERWHRAAGVHTRLFLILGMTPCQLSPVHTIQLSGRARWGLPFTRWQRTRDVTRNRQTRWRGRISGLSVFQGGMGILPMSEKFPPSHGRAARATSKTPSRLPPTGRCAPIALVRGGCLDFAFVRFCLTNPDLPLRDSVSL